MESLQGGRVTNMELLEKIKKLQLKELKSRKNLHFIISGVLVLFFVPYLLYLLYTVYIARATPATIVHDTQAEFQAGVENRLETSADPYVISTYHELPADEHTVGLWHMNEGSDNTCSGGEDTCDFSGSGNHGTFAGNTSFTSTAKLGGYATVYDGVDDRVTLPSTLMNGLSGGTIEIWFKSDVVDKHRALLSYGAQDDPHYLAIYGVTGSSPNTIKVFRNSSSLSNGSMISSSTIIADNWYHVAVVWDDADMRLYVNGVHENTLDGDFDATASQDTWLGMINNRDYDWGGIIDEVAIHNRALMPEEIKANAQRRPYGVYTSEVLDLGSNIYSIDDLQWTEAGVSTGDGETPYSTTGLVAQWNLNETDDNTCSGGEDACDSSGSANHGVAYNFGASDVCIDAGQDNCANSGWTANNKKWGAGAMMFDGTDDYFEDSDFSTDLTNMTMSFWFKGKPIATDHQRLIDVFGINRNAIHISDADLAYGEIPANAIGFFDSSNTNEIYALWKDNWSDVWINITISCSGNSCTLFINGQEEASGTISTRLTTGTGVRVGATINNSYYVNGIFDSTSLYTRELTPEEILSNYQAGQVEFQTRTSADGSTWEEWKPNTSESQIESMDESMEKWHVDSYMNSSSTINKISAIDDGDSADEAITVSSDKNINTDNMISGRSCADGGDAVNYSDTTLEKAGETSVTVSSTPSSGCLAAGDEILIINLQGTSSNYGAVGQWETHTISSISTATLNFTDYPLYHTHDGTTQKIMIQRVPNYTNVTVNSSQTLTTSAWDGTKGGVLFFRANGTVTVTGTISVNGRGYRGGNGVSSTGQNAYQGESTRGTGTQSTSRNLDGGGGGGKAGAIFCEADDQAGGGAGGGYGTAGEAGGMCGTDYSEGGNAYSSADLSKIYLGSGGGGGASEGYSRLGGTGGRGGGIIILSTNSLTVSGNISSNGQDGGDGSSTAGGGGGSGGSIYLEGSFTLGTNLVTATGGDKGSSYEPGVGGSGRIAIYYTGSLSGSTDPVAYVQKYDSTVKAEGSGALKATLSAPQVDSSTVGLWHLDETNGDLAGDDVFDETSNNNDGEFYGSNIATGVVDGISRKAREFNGSDDYIDCGDPPGGSLDFGASDSFTIETWLKTDFAYSVHGPIVSKYNGPNYYILRLRGAAEGAAGKPRFYINDGTNTPVKDCSIAVNDGKWHYIVAVRDVTADTLQIYLDGIGCDSAITDTTTGTLENNYNFVIGRYDAGGEVYNGILDEVRISNTARTAEEIAESYRAGRDHRLSRTISSTNLSGKTKLPFYIAADRPGTYLETTIGESSHANYETDANTVGLWHLEEETGSGAYIKDSSSSGNHGTPTGTTSFAQGKIGRARSFSNGYVDTNIITSPGAKSLSYWVKYDTVSTGDPQLQGIQEVGRYFYNGISNGGQGYFYAGNTGGNYNYTFSAGKWYFVAMTMDGSGTGAGTTRQYVNGDLVDSLAYASDATPTLDFYIGKLHGGSIQYPFDATIDEFRISNVARTAEEIRQAYEIGQRTHPITIDFVASLDSGNLITGSGDTSFTIDATTYGFSNKGDNLYLGDKIIVKENYGGTEYIAQGTVTSVTASSGAVTVSGWDTGSTFPTGGYTVNATVFKWQREYFDLRSSLSTHRDAITNLTLRVTDGSEGRTIWLDDFKNGGPYLTDPAATGNVSSTTQRYMQYRFFESLYDTVITPEVSSVTLNYNQLTASAYAADLSGHGNVFAGKTLDISSKYSDGAGASDLDKMYLRIQNPGGTDIEYYGDEGGDANGLTPTAVTGSEYVTAITYDRDAGNPTANDITVTWHITFDWDWTENTNVEYGVRAVEDGGADTGWDYTDNNYKYENDLDYTGTIAVTGTVQGSLTSGDWVQGSESINWTGLTVVYEGETTVYPPDSDFDARVSDDDGGTWDDLVSSGEAINIDSTADAAYDGDDIHNIDIIGDYISSGGSDVSSEAFTIRVDDSGPTIDTLTSSSHPNQSNWYNDNTPAFDWTTTDGESGVEAVWRLIDQTASHDAAYVITNGTQDIEDGNWTSGVLADGTWYFHLAVRNNANYTAYSSFTVNIDTTDPIVDTLTSSSHPNESNWYTDDTPAFEWTSSDTGSGVEATWRLIDQTASHDAAFVITNGTQDVEDGNWTSGELANGTWYFHLAVRDNASRTAYDSYTANIDDSVPDIVDITGANEGVWQGSDSGPVISWTDPTSASDDTFYITNDGSEPTNSNYEYTTGSPSYDLPDQGEGTTTVRVRPQNGAGTYGTTYNFVIKYDVSDPQVDTLTSSSHPNESNWYSDDTPAFEWNTSDVYSGVEATWRLIDQTASHDAAYVITNGTQDIEDGNWTSGELANGTWYFHLAVRDNVNRTNYDSFTVNIDDSAPVIDTLTSSSHPNQSNWYNDNTPAFDWTTTDGESGVEATWRLVDQTATHDAAHVISNGTQDVEDGNWTSGVLAEGTWYFHLAVRNNASLTAYASFTVNIDTADPTVDTLTSSTNPNESNWYSDDTPTVSWTTSDSGSGVEQVWRLIDQTASHDAAYVISNGTGDNEDDSWTSGELANGTWYFHLAVRDNASKTAYSSFTLNIDDSVPDIVDVTGNYEGTWQSSDSGPVISWTDPASPSDDTFYITNDGSTPTSSNYQYTTTSASFDLPDQGEGETTIKVRPQNGAGTYGSAHSFIIRYDNTDPVNVSNLIATSLSSSSIRLDWDNPGSDFDHVVIKRKTSGIPSSPNDGTTVYSGSSETYTDTELSSATKYYYTVFVYDAAGNNSSGAVVSKTTLTVTDTGEEEEVEEETLIEELTETGEEVEEVEQEELVEEEKNILFFIDGTEVEVTDQSDLHAFASSSIEAKIPLKIIMEGKEGLGLIQAILIVGDEVFIMQLDQSGEYYTAKFQAPEIKGELDIGVVVTYSDESGKKINIELTIDPYGYVYAIEGGNELRIKDAEITLYKEVDGKEQKWDTNTEQYANPQYTNEQGEYFFFVEPGKYKLIAKVAGYSDGSTDWLEVTARTVEKNIELKKIVNYWVYVLYALPVLVLGSGIVIFILVKRKRSQKSKVATSDQVKEQANQDKKNE